MGALYDALESLSPVHDAEVLDGYRRYEATMADILTPEQIEIYANYIAQTDEIRVFDEMTHAEMAALPPGMFEVATAIVANTPISMENRRVVSLLSQHGEHEATPDYHSTSNMPRSHT